MQQNRPLRQQNVSEQLGSFVDVVSATNNIWMLDNNGNVFSIGRGTSGNLGSLSIEDVSSPVSVVGNHAFSKLGPGLGIKSDGTAWKWGYGSDGNNGNLQISNNSSPVSVVGNHLFVNVSDSGNCAIKSDGSVWTWGYGAYGMNGDYTAQNRSSPVSVVGEHAFVSVTFTGSYSALALKADGTAWSWGYNGYGQLGDRTTAHKSSPISVVGDHSFIQIASGYGFNLALKDDGTCWAWGNNDSGNLGDRTVVSKSSPVSVHGGHSFIHVAASLPYAFSLGLKSNGEVWFWGKDDTYGIVQVSGDTTSSSSPRLLYTYPNLKKLRADTGQIIALTSYGTVLTSGWSRYGLSGCRRIDSKSSPSVVVGHHSFSKISTGYATAFAIKSSGELFSWGSGDNGKIGNLSWKNYNYPIPAACGHRFYQVYSGLSQSIGLKSDGTCWTWGYNASGFLGTYASGNTSSPVSVVGNHSFIQIQSNSITYANYGLKENGTCWSWGYNNRGQLGDNSIVDRSSPVSVVGNHSFIKIASGSAHAVGLKSDGTAWAWGSGSGGRLGNGSDSNASSPISIIGNHSFVDVKAGRIAALGLKNDGTVWTWGDNSYGQLGIRSSSNTSSPVSVHGDHSFIKIFFSDYRVFALKDDGTAWTWGYNYRAQMGTGDMAHRSSPVSITGSHSFIDICGGQYFSLALKADGSVWSWGQGTFGQLGDGQDIPTTSPVAVHFSQNYRYAKPQKGDKYVQVAASNMKAWYLKADGTLWFMGNNYFSGASNTSSTIIKSPVAVVGGHLFRSVVASSNINTYALKADGSCWAWGRGYNGAIGDNSSTARSSPVSVVGGHSFIQIAAYTGGGQGCVALKADGTAWCWGISGAGWNGDYRSTTRSSPVSVVGDHSFIQITRGSSSTHGLKIDGSAWSWGDNGEGGLGDYTLIDRSSPVSVVGGHNFTSIAGSNDTTFALKADGTAWAWGSNSYGQLGIGGYSGTRSSPVSVIGAHNFIKIVTMPSAVLGIKSDGTVWGWGYNTGGYFITQTQLETHYERAITSPVLCISHPNIKITDVFAYSGYAVGLASNGNMYYWGKNTRGQIGPKNIGTYNSPIQIFSDAQAVQSSDSARGYRYFVLKNSGLLYSWGYTGSGGLGDGRPMVTLPDIVPVPTIGDHSFVDMFSDAYGAYGLKSDGSIWSWGSGIDGRLGHYSLSSMSSPVSVVGGHTFIKGVGNGYTGACALKADGSVWTWGNSNYGALGNLTSSQHASSPVSVVGGYSFLDIATCGTYTYCALNIDGTAWTWGYGGSGRLGNNTTQAGRSSPTSVVGDHSFVALSGSRGECFLALKSDGTCWAWGDNSYGGLGDNSTSNRSSPVSVIGAHSFIDVMATAYSSYALKSNGEIWTWGHVMGGCSNRSNLINDVPISDIDTMQSSPVRLLGGHSFIKILPAYGTAICLAQKDDGTIWGWGALGAITGKWDVSLKPLIGTSYW